MVIYVGVLFEGLEVVFGLVSDSVDFANVLLIGNHKLSNQLL